jgi:hypothetical protein
MMDQSMTKLQEIWQQDQDSEEILNEYLSKEYPFEESFDDIQLKVHRWVSAFETSFVNYTLDTNHPMKVYAVIIGDKRGWYGHPVLRKTKPEAEAEAAEIAKRWTEENDDDEYTLHEDGKWKSKDDYIYVQEYELK